MSEGSPAGIHFPGQVEVFRLQLEHVRALASPVRALVFWSFSSRDPKSISDIANEVGRTPQSVRYHVNGLHELGLILGVDRRKRRSRTEELYVRAGLTVIDIGPAASPLYNRYRTRGFKLEAKKMAKEMAHHYGLLETRSELAPLGMWKKAHLRLAPEDVVRLRADISAALERAIARHVGPEEGVEVNVVNYIRPTMLQFHRWADQMGVSVDTFNRDDSDLDVPEEE